jgi:hypothetical protein
LDSWYELLDAPLSKFLEKTTILHFTAASLDYSKVANVLRVGLPALFTAVRESNDTLLKIVKRQQFQHPGFPCSVLIHFSTDFLEYKRVRNRRSGASRLYPASWVDYILCMSQNLGYLV